MSYIWIGNNKYKEYKQVKADIDSAKEMLNDKELHELAQMEIVTGEEKLLGIEEELKILLLPKDPNDDKNVIVEIRGGAGGEEAALFAGVLYRMYSRYAERHRWKVEIMNENTVKQRAEEKVTNIINKEKLRKMLEAEELEEALGEKKQEEET